MLEKRLQKFKNALMKLKKKGKKIKMGFYWLQCPKGTTTRQRFRPIRTDANSDNWRSTANKSNPVWSSFIAQWEGFQLPLPIRGLISTPQSTYFLKSVNKHSGKVLLGHVCQRRLTSYAGNDFLSLMRVCRSSKSMIWHSLHRKIFEGKLICDRFWE